jgi:hypothetical protein
MLKKKVLILEFIIFLSLISLIFSFVLAAEDRELEIKYPAIFGLKPETVKTGLPVYVKYIYNFAIFASGLMALIALILGGIRYLTSAGDPTKLKEAREQISSAFLGIVILLGSYIILTAINPQLTLFEFPILGPFGIPEVPLVTPLRPEEISLITLELPLGQSVEKGLWAEEERTKIENLLKEDEDFLIQDIEVASPEFNRVSDLNKYLKKITEDCLCQNLKPLCTKPNSFCEPIGCVGDPCPEEKRDEMAKIIKINQGKIEKLLEFQKKILEEKTKVEKELAIFSDINQEIISCREQGKGLFSLNEYLSQVNYYREQGWGLEIINIPNAPKSKGDFLTFYCPVGGTIFDYSYYPNPEMAPEIPGELAMPEVSEEITRISCPVEFALGEVLDSLQELAVLLIVKMEKLAASHEKMASSIEKLHELVSQCTDKNCQIDCKCIPNFCYLSCINPVCAAICRSPCLQCIGGCKGDPCPREDIGKTVAEIKKFEDEISLAIKEIRKLFPRVESLLKSEENPKNLENIRKGMNLCYAETTETEVPAWELFSCKEAIGNYGSHEEIINGCHPRNYFCCTPSGEIFPGAGNFPRSEEYLYELPVERYAPLPVIGNCPQGWLCDDDVKTYNQYNDASEPIKELLSCMRLRLDNVREAMEIEETIGRISSISDSKIYEGTCQWESGSSEPGGCSHTYGIKYEKEKVSAHYGGTECRYERQSYAVDFGDEENADYIIEAAKQCRPDASVLFRTPGHYDHIHISTAGAYGCGAD